MQKIIKTISGIVALFMLAAFPITSFASGVPQITTLSATAPTATTVTLNGFFSANGANTSTWFKYGTTANNLTGNSAPIDRGNGSGQFSATLTGLTPNTTYYFKAAGSNFYGMTLGSSTLSFTTTVAQSATLSLVTLSASNVTSSSAKLNGHYSATITSPTTWFKYGTSQGNMNLVSAPQSMVVGSNNYSANISGLQAGTTYYFQAIGSQAGIMTSASSVLQFTTVAAPVSSMTVTSFAQTNVTTTSADIHGYITMTNTSATARYFKYGTSQSNMSSTLTVAGGQTAPGMFNGSLTGLTPDTTYFYKAYAVSAAGVTYSGSALQFHTVAIIVPTTYQCNDGIDNDGDGLTDFPADPGCSSVNDNNEYNVPPVTYQCNDGIDNDGDGYTDFPADAGCTSTTDNNEYNVPPVTFVCNDGIDNDGDSLVDYPADPGCSSTNDQSEYNTVQTGTAPTATTTGANNISQTDVTLTGSLNANNSYSYYWFEYGTNGAFSSSTSQMSFGTGSGNVNQSLGGLQTNTTYSYRLCASNAYGQNCGSTLSFTTLQNSGCTSNCGGCTYNCGGNSAPTVNTSSASNITDTSAIINGYANPNNYNGYTATQVWFKYGVNGNLSYTANASQGTISSAQSVSAFLSNLQANTVYSFQTCAGNQYGQNCGNVLSFITTNTNAYVPVQPPYYPPYNPQYPPQYPEYPTYPQQPPIIIYTNGGNGGYDYAEGSSSLATLKINASKRDVVRNDLVSYTITLSNESNRSLKNVKMNVNAPIDLALSSTSYGELSFATNSVTVSFSSLAAGDSKTITVTARVASNTTAKSFVVHSDASYLNTRSGERETVTAEVMTGVGSNGLLAGAFGAGFGGGLIWFLVIILIVLLMVLLFSKERRRAVVVEAAVPPSRWPSN